jgi:hypothetical protein
MYWESVMCQRFQKSFTLRAANGLSKFSATGIPINPDNPIAISQKPEKLQ